MFDLKEMKRTILCSDVAKKYGLQLKERHGRLWGKLRPDEKTESFSINLKNNLWYDFGSGKGGSVIDLCGELEGISPKDAINLLAEEYGFKSNTTRGWNPLTDSQYRELGIQPEKATMNFAIDLNKHTIEQAERWSNKYGMHVKELAIQYPEVYNRMIVKFAMEEINTLRDAYNTRLKMYHDSSTNNTTKEYLKAMSKSEADELNRKVELLQRAVTTTTINYMYLQVNFEKDFKPLEQRKSLEKSLANEDEKIRDRIVNVYKKLFNFHQVDYFTIEQAKALQDINKMLSKSDNKYLPIDGIKQAYKVLGEKLDKLEKNYSHAIEMKDKLGNVSNTIEYQKIEQNIERIKEQIIKIKELFIKCNTVIDGIREANLIQKNENTKNNQNERTRENNVELSH